MVSSLETKDTAEVIIIHVATFTVHVYTVVNMHDIVSILDIYAPSSVTYRNPVGENCWRHWMNLANSSGLER